MTILESISKEISKKPTQRAWNKLCALFEQGTEEDHKQGLEMIAPKISKWKKSLTLELAVHASDPVHPLLPHVEKASITVDGLSEVPQALATALVKSVLKVLTLTGCEKLTNVQALASAKKLRQLDIIWARNLGDLSGLEHLKSLRKLSIIGSYKLSDLSILQNLKHLTYLNLTEGKFNDLQGLKTLSQIKILHVPNCRMLRSLEGIQECSALEYLNFCYCDALQNIQGLAKLTKLKNIDFTNCDYLDVTSLHHTLLTKPKEIQSCLVAIRNHYA